MPSSPTNRFTSTCAVRVPRWACARLFRLPAAHTGTEILESTAARLAWLPVPQVRALLADLARIHLLDETVPHRNQPPQPFSSYSDAGEPLEWHSDEPAPALAMGAT